KTPLTSIINYVDLIKREKIQDPKIQGYLEVLEQKSQRLKTLTEDLVEASKASSGNLKLDITSIDFVELIHQTNGEFEEKFALRHLELVSTLPAESILIEADGRYLWRVLENLYNNAGKYAMEHSRVYVDITEEEDMAVFTMKNISQNPLNIHADELTERFVRGDVARTTEGSGLGISIAKSLAELQGGELRLYIDGDLFKAGVAFPIKK
ncbi:MAG: sensor histidine kinase, partial [Enterococcus thailandicus]|nr:sensor histidine kinase [Enterococcus thailandicus]